LQVGPPRQTGSSSGAEALRQVRQENLEGPLKARVGQIGKDWRLGMRRQGAGILSALLIGLGAAGHALADSGQGDAATRGARLEVGRTDRADACARRLDRCRNDRWRRLRSERRRSAHRRVRGRRVRVRKDVKELSAQERRQFVEAVLKLKSVRSPYDPSLSYYDQFVAWHLTLSRCHPDDLQMRHAMSGHGGPMFLPWHREFVLLFENALRDVSGSDVTVPYWDWTDPQSTRAVFADDFMGGDGNPNDGFAVTTGPFRKGQWQLVVQPIGLEWSSSATSYITRRLGRPDELPRPDDVRSALAAPLYDAAPYDMHSDPSMSFRNALEGWRPPLPALMACGPDGVVAAWPRPGSLALHNLVHQWVGGVLAPGAGVKVFGTMLTLPTSPNDPVFFLHHANIDRIWARWQQSNGIHTYRPVSGYPHNNVDDTMHPFNESGLSVTPRTIADVAELGYRYTGMSIQSRPSAGRAPRAATIAASRRQTLRGLVCRLDRARYLRPKRAADKT
jgi:tyrosinase